MRIASSVDDRAGAAGLRWALVCLVVCIAAAGAAHAADDRATARATLRDAAGKEIGKVWLEDTPHGVLVKLQLSGAPPGEHGFHIHQTGKCSPPFTSAGGHFNPGGKAHGFRAADGFHAGDLPNVHVPDSGKLELEVLATEARLGDGPNGLLDADGSAFVMHEGADDYTSQPAGAAGPRIACGVITSE